VRWLPWTAVAIQLAQYRLAGLRHLVAWLGDIIPVPPPHAVVGIGDLLLLAGTTLLLAFGTRPALDG
jgi:hypothetical protein